MICENCGVDFSNDWRKDKKTRKTPCRFCCRACSNTRNHSKDTKIKIKNSIIGFCKKENKNLRKRLCENCGIEFNSKKHTLCKKCRIKRVLSEDTKDKLSAKRKAFLESGKSHVIWYSFISNGKEIKVQGNWEKALAEKLIELNIKFDRRELRFEYHRRYTPDFFLIDYNIFIEVKGFFYEKDKLKMFLCLEENNVDLRIIENIDIIKNIKTIEQVLSIPVFKEKYKKEDIRLEKFFNRYLQR